jgi:4-alpha-glucanotransferase
VDQGGVTRHTADDSRVRLLAAMHLDASTDEAADRALAELRRASQRPLPSVVVGSEANSARLTVTTARHDDGQAWEWDLEVAEENGSRLAASGRKRSRDGALRLTLPGRLPLGYHRVRLTLKRPGTPPIVGEQLRIVTPAHCPTTNELLGDRAAFGMLANLYTVRSARNWGAGDLTDLRRLVAFAANQGASFVGVNPLHAIINAGSEISPYSPVSRLYRNPLYLDVEAIPELDDLPALRRLLATPARRTELKELRALAQVDYERVMQLKEPVLRDLHRRFAARHRGHDTARGRAYDRYLESQSEALTEFATFMALKDRLGWKDRRGWKAWPARYRDSGSAAVREFRNEESESVDFHRYLQFEIDRQLATVARKAGTMPIGVYQDLAIGSAGHGSDAWAFRDLFLQGANVGAAPDNYAAQGQNWGFPPVSPRQLAADGYRYWILLVRSVLRHAGALRIDHVMGLFRQYWIPADCEGSKGAYVRFPAEDLLGILALESRRAGALVIGEDLGTVPRGLPRILRRWGILSTRVLYFERSSRGTFKRASRYEKNALVSANTHDLVPLAGFWGVTDLAIRRAVGLLGDPREWEEQARDRARARRFLVRLLRAEGVLGKTQMRDETELRRAVYEFLSRTPAALVGVSLDDLMGETNPVNLPGVDADRFPSWTRKQRLPIEALSRNAEVRRVLAGVKRRRRLDRSRRRNEK